MKNSNVIAIDGPAASGKSTVAALVAKYFNIPCVNTGSMYRAVTLAALQHQITKENCSEDNLTEVMQDLNLRYGCSSDGRFELFLNDRLIEEELRSSPVVAMVSQVAALPNVRSFLKECQRKFAEQGMMVMEGRDIGTEIFPDAKYKFFVTATPMERARRRLTQNGGPIDDAQLQQIAHSIAERDHLDSTRAIAPLRPSDDAMIVDTTSMKIEDVVNLIVKQVEQK